MNPTELDFPADLLYLVEHDVWARLHGDGSATLGITALGIRLAGEIYMCRAKPVGSAVEQGRSLGVVELAKAIVSVKSALSGTLIEANALLADTPELVHRDPYGSGWIARLVPTRLEHERAQLIEGGQVADAMRKHRQLMEGAP